MESAIQLLRDLLPVQKVHEQLVAGGEAGLNEATLRRWLIARKVQQQQQLPAGCVGLCSRPSTHATCPPCRWTWQQQLQTSPSMQPGGLHGHQTSGSWRYVSSTLSQQQGIRAASAGMRAGYAVDVCDVFLKIAIRHFAAPSPVDYEGQLRQLHACMLGRSAVRSWANLQLAFGQCITWFAYSVTCSHQHACEQCCSGCHQQLPIAHFQRQDVGERRCGCLGLCTSKTVLHCTAM